MLIQPTLDALNHLKLHGMATALSEQLSQAAARSLGFEERLGLLVEREVTHRENRRLTRLLQLAQLKQRACLEDLDVTPRRGLDRSQIASLSSGEWIRSGQNLAIHAATGCGKTFLACAFAQLACRQGMPALYVRAPRLFEELALCHADGSFRKRLAAIAKVQLLVIDDFAISPIGQRERNDLLEILDDRVGARATIITSQLPTEYWHDYIGDPTLADAILDRFLHNAHKIRLEGESRRKHSGADDGKVALKSQRKLTDRDRSV